MTEKWTVKIVLSGPDDEGVWTYSTGEEPEMIWMFSRLSEEKERAFFEMPTFVLKVDGNYIPTNHISINRYITFKGEDTATVVVGEQDDE